MERPRLKSMKQGRVAGGVSKNISVFSCNCFSSHLSFLCYKLADSGCLLYAHRTRCLHLNMFLECGGINDFKSLLLAGLMLNPTGPGAHVLSVAVCVLIFESQVLTEQSLLTTDFQ